MAILSYLAPGKVWNFTSSEVHNNDGTKYSKLKFARYQYYVFQAGNKFQERSELIFSLNKLVFKS